MRLSGICLSARLSIAFSNLLTIWQIVTPAYPKQCWNVFLDMLPLLKSPRRLSESCNILTFGQNLGESPRSQMTRSMQQEAPACLMKTFSFIFFLSSSTISNLYFLLITTDLIKEAERHRYVLMTEMSQYHNWNVIFSHFDFRNTKLTQIKIKIQVQENSFAFFFFLDILAEWRRK